MNGALMEIMKDDVNKKINAAVDEGKQELTVGYIKDVMAKLKYTAEQAMDLLNIPQKDWDTYAGLIKKEM